MHFSKITRTRRRGDPNRAPPREAKNPDTLVNFDGFVDAFGRPNAERPPDAPVASEAYTPRPKDCTRLGPNTLKKNDLQVLRPCITALQLYFTAVPPYITEICPI